MFRLPECIREDGPAIPSAMLCACGTAFSLLTGLSGVFDVQEVLLYTFLGAIFPFVLGFLPRFRPLGLLALLLLPGIAWFEGKGPFFELEQLFRALFASFMDRSVSLLPFLDHLCTLASLLCGLLYGFICRERAVGAAAALGMGLLFAAAYMTGDKADLIPYLLLYLGGMGLLMAFSGEVHLIPALLVTGGLLLLSFLLFPRGLVLEPVKKQADLVRETVQDHLPFTSGRDSFSLSSEGYLPLNDRLGGTAQPDPSPVMLVKCDEKVYLRAVAADMYNGRGWYDTLGTRRYPYSSSGTEKLRREVFDADRPLGVIPPEEKSVEVELLSPQTTTLYAPGHMKSIVTASKRMVLYWNEGSELFITRNLEKGDRYTVSYLPFRAGEALTGRMVAFAARTEDENFSAVSQKYLTVPGHIQQEIYDIAREAAGNAEMPYEKALNIASWLRRSCTYSLTVSTPPEGLDFCAWFLLREREGYCTYFATAMTLLCRIEGIPARYVTGFLARPENGTAVVTGEDAHAWCEIYLNGFGWLAVESVPGNGEEEDETRTDEKPDDREEEDPVFTPPPSQEPVPPSPSPDPQSASNETPAPSPHGPESGEEQSPPSPSPENTGAAAENGKDASFLWWLLLLLPAFALAGKVFLSSPEKRAHRDPERKAEIYARDILLLIRTAGFTREKDETLLAFGLRLEKASDRKGRKRFTQDMNACCAALSEAYYAEKPVKTDELKKRDRMLFYQLSPFRKLHYLIFR